MTTIEKLYIIADNNNIPVFNVSLKGLAALSVTDDLCYAIGIDYAQIKNSADERVKLSHELGHCLNGAFYNIYSRFDCVAKCEYKADKWAIKKLLPQDDVITAINKGYTEVWQLAEYFDVTEELVKKAFWIYFDKQV